MKPLAVISLLVIFGVALSSHFTAASASRMNGKCCMSSDGGRSHRYGVAMRRAAIVPTCSAYAALCIRNSSMGTHSFRSCLAAKALCMRTGVHVSPYSGRQYAGMQRK
jgi:hypothetical protein